MGRNYLSPSDYCYLVDLDAIGDLLEFQLMPDTITESKSANYDQIPIIGRSLPHLGYSSSSARQLNLSLEFVALSRTEKYTPDWVISQVRWLESKVYPQYKGGLAFPPPRLLIIIGSVIGMTAVMTSVNTTWMKPWTDDPSLGGCKPFRAQVDCSFEEYGENDKYGYPFGHDDAHDGKNQNLM